MTEQLRKEFEAWWRHEHENTLYCESAWRGWQASRATLVIELPDVMDARPDGSGRYELFEMSATDYREECKLIIEAAGLGVRS